MTLLIAQAFNSAQAGEPSFTSVGPVADPNCDFSSIQEAILATSENIHVVDGIYVENINITDSSETLVGGFSDCNAAESGVREAGSKSAIVPDTGVALIATANGGGLEDVTMTGFTISQGQAAGFAPAGGLVITGSMNLTMFDSYLVENTGVLGGAAYVGPDASFFMRDTLVQNNTAVTGGGIYCAGCVLTIDRGSGVSDNQAVGNGMDTDDALGGGVFMNNGAQVLIFSGSKTPEQDALGIHNNTAAKNGGGIYLEESELFIYGDDFFGFGDTVNPVNISSNEAVESGGGIYASFDAVITATAIDLRDNVAGVSGGGIDLFFATGLTIHGEDLFSAGSCWNESPQKCNRMINNGILNGSAGSGTGGAIDMAGGVLNIFNTWFEGNHAGGDGSGLGAVLLVENTDVNIENSVMHKNGFVTGEDRNILHFSANGEGINMRFNTLVDNNNVTDAIIHLLGDGFNIRNSIVHQTNDAPVLTIQGSIPEFGFNCMLVHEDASLTGLGGGSIFATTVGDPVFYNREAGDFNLYSESLLALDQCSAGPVPPPDFDLNLNTRGLDFNQVGNDFFGFYDIGAIEYQGSDLNLDIIFADGFD
ncbi:hypothetical protein [Marinicella sp. W31]|uniref:hypothetical protein n=1 Tax=Marinicella sp. W31 TaxID=3023713 RepID=UPI0037578385